MRVFFYFLFLFICLVFKASRPCLCEVSQQIYPSGRRFPRVVVSTPIMFNVLKQ